MFMVGEQFASDVPDMWNDLLFDHFAGGNLFCGTFGTGCLVER
jgi:hypothetical protein